MCFLRELQRPKAPFLMRRCRLSLTGHVKPNWKRTGLVKLSALVSGTWKEFEPRTGVTAPPYVHGGSGETLA